MSAYKSLSRIKLKTEIYHISELLSQNSTTRSYSPLSRDALGLTCSPLASLDLTYVLYLFLAANVAHQLPFLLLTQKQSNQCIFSFHHTTDHPSQD